MTLLKVKCNKTFKTRPRPSKLVQLSEIADRPPHSRGNRGTKNLLETENRHSNRKSEHVSTCQTHDVLRVDPTLECLQGWQIVPIDIDKRCCGLHVVPVQ